MPFKMQCAAAAALLLSAGAVNATDITRSDNIAVYWGQNSYGQGSGSLAQQSLGTYCANSNINIIPLAFLYQITSGTGGQPVLNFANQQNDCSTFPDTETIHCPQIAADIKTCQQKYGKTIVLSVGGATYTEGGFSSASDASTYADKLWAMFGPQQSGSSALRPFDDAVVDGFDFDFESYTTNTAPFAQRLRSNMNGDSSKKYYLTAAPQCPYPDAADNDMLNGGVPFDAVFVQFYNNYCGSQSYQSGTNNQNNFDFSSWDDWAKTGSANKNVKIFLGVPAGPSGAGSGYESASQLKDEINYCRSFSSFGGVMMWDASQAYANNGFISGIKSDLQSAKRSLEGRNSRAWFA
ncbi:glycoside hydrolase family 18 protein [Acrodontium crateriforme]|uniref:chitinase n=1 Tax=Acrodontium crateriforme TaxID=150365 RepID=A0AAQ3LXR1_9PEZI|nr:glycoside hydrolase family 18 protein [Acrodontium crateriforme]